jgi:hypothetical protein
MSTSEWDAKMQREMNRRAFAARFVMSTGRYPTNDEYPVER